jgi:hypothetical protein
MMKRVLVLLAAATTVLLSGCNVLGLEGDCAGVGYWAVTVTVRDATGRPQALGATVTLQDGTYEENHVGTEDSLTVYGASDRGGRTYDIHVTKPYYNDVSVRGVRAPGGGCVTGHESSPTNIKVPIVLSLAPNAPPVRSIHLLPTYTPILDRDHAATFTFATVVDANPGISQAVLWTVGGDTATAGFNLATGLFTYRCQPKNGMLTVTAAAAANPSITATASIATQGHPNSTTDPAC